MIQQAARWLKLPSQAAGAAESSLTSGPTSQATRLTSSLLSGTPMEPDERRVLLGVSPAAAPMSDTHSCGYRAHMHGAEAAYGDSGTGWLVSPPMQGRSGDRSYDAAEALASCPLRTTPGASWLPPFCTQTCWSLHRRLRAFAHACGARTCAEAECTVKSRGRAHLISRHQRARTPAWHATAPRLLDPTAAFALNRRPWLLQWPGLLAIPALAAECLLAASIF